MITALVLMPGITIYVCPDSPVSLMTVRRAVGVWAFPDDLTVKLGSKKRCAAPPHDMTAHVTVYTPAKAAEYGQGPGVYALTENNVYPLNNGVGVIMSGTVMIPDGVDGWTVVHEVGHLLGRDHATDPEDVMFPVRTAYTRYIVPWTYAEYWSIWERGFAPGPGTWAPGAGLSPQP